LKERASVRPYWHCKTCDLVFLDPALRFDPTDEKKHYSLHQNSIHDTKYCAFLKKLITPLLTKVEEVSGKESRGLDYGSGPEPVLAQLVRHAGYRMDIFDPFFADDRTVLSRTYDFVSCCEVVEHMYDPHAGFSQLDAVLKSGGVLGVMTGMIPSWSMFAAWHYPKESTHVCFYSLQTMSWLGRFFKWRLVSVENNVTIFLKD